MVESGQQVCVEGHVHACAQPLISDPSVDVVDLGAAPDCAASFVARIPVMSKAPLASKLFAALAYIQISFAFLAASTNYGFDPIAGVWTRAKENR